MYDLDKIMDAKKKLTGWLHEELECGKEHVACHVEQLGDLVDMIKDLSEAEEKCVKACYYMEVLRDMNEEAAEMTEKYGYDHYRYSSGRFAPKGHGHYSAGYTPHTSGKVRVHEPHMDGDFRMGYDNWPEEKMNMSEKGRKYDEWDQARRHYHESGDMESKKRMDEKMSHNIASVISQVREMNEEASPEMRANLKAEVSKLMQELNKVM